MPVTTADSCRRGHLLTPENLAPNGKAKPACRTCKNASARRLYAADVDKSRAATAERMRRHRGGVRGNANARKTHCREGHRYDDANTYVTKAGMRQCRECKKARSTESFQRHRDKRMAEHRAYCEKNRDAIRATYRAWAQANRERANLNSRLKKQRRRAAGVLTAPEWAEILERHGNVCLACGSDGPLTIDHVVPISKGGTNTADNVQPLCGPCNVRKATKTIDYRPVLAAA